MTRDELVTRGPRSPWKTCIRQPDDLNEAQASAEQIMQLLDEDGCINVVRGSTGESGDASSV